MKFTEYCLVLITCPDQQTAETIASFLVEEKLAACVNILQDVKSIYHWQGNLENDQEILLLVKTKIEKFDPDLISHVIELHPYQVPELIAIPMISGSPDYLAWMETEMQKE